MASKKVLAGKHAKLPRKNDHTKEFQKDWRRLQHRGINLATLKEVMGLLIANEGPLPAEWKDHALQGVLSGYRECHAGGDLLLMYSLAEDDQQIIFVRAGTHAELFE